MMTGLWVVFIFILVALLTEILVFGSRRARLKKKEQCFKFHDFRDRLQLLTIAGKIQPDSELHNFLLMTVNVAIRNAGVFKFRDMIEITKNLRTETDGEKLQDREYPTEVQALASEVCSSFAWMLVANDDLTVWLFKGLGILTQRTNDAVVKCAKWIVARLAPRRVAIVRAANDFDRLGQRLAPSY
jgi:hypothetical protein